MDIQYINSLPSPIGKDVPCIVLGCSPFVWGRQFDAKSALYESRFRGKPDAVIAVWTAFAESGGKAIHIVDDEDLCNTFDEFRPQWPDIDVWFTISDSNIEKWCQRLMAWGGTRIFRHAKQVDSGEDLHTFIDLACACGLKPGVATHSPGKITKPELIGNYESLSFLVPFNPRQYHMDISPELLHKRLKSRPGESFAMMPLASGRVNFANGLAFAAIHFKTQLVGTGDPDHARKLARIAPALQKIGSSKAFFLKSNRQVDISVSKEEIVILRDHKGLRLSGIAQKIWSMLCYKPLTLAELLEWAVKDSGHNDSSVLADIAGLLLHLIDWDVVEVIQ